MAKVSFTKAIPAAGFCLQLVDRPKKQLGENMANAGFFGFYEEGDEEFTLPVAHLVADYEAENKWTRFYCEERGEFDADGVKYRHDCTKSAYQTKFSGKAVSTLIVKDGLARIEDIAELPECDYAVSGVPVLRNGADCKFTAYVKEQGWGDTSLRATWHNFVGLKEDDPCVVYLMKMRTYTKNLVQSSEAYHVFKALGFRDVIKLDGGMSFYLNADGKTYSTGGNRIINSIITFPGVDEEMTETQLRTAVVATMKSWLGYSEANGKHKKIIDLYNAHKPLARGYAVQYTDEWCATTVSAAFIKNGLTDIAPTECSCPKMIDLYKAKGRWQESDSYVPSPGDIIMYDWEDSGKGDNTGAPNHVGIVASVSGDSIQVIEGNKGEAVAYRTLAVNGKYIRGYCLPDYAGRATKKTGGNTVDVTLNVLKKGSKGEDVKALQMLLNGHGYSCGTADGSFGSKTQAAVKKFQTAKKLDVDGSVGKQTWSALLGA